MLGNKFVLAEDVSDTVKCLVRKHDLQLACVLQRGLAEYLIVICDKCDNPYFFMNECGNCAKEVLDSKCKKLQQENAKLETVLSQI